MAVHRSLDQDAEYFLDRLGVSWYLNFTAGMTGVPDAANKLPYVREMDPSRLPSPQDIATMVRNAPPGTVWYVGGEPNRKGVGWERFAETFHYYYTHITAADPTATLTGPSVLNWDFTCIGCGGFQQGKVWLTNFINAYESKYGQPVPVGAWAIDVYPIDWNNTANNDPDRLAMYNGVPTQHWRIAVDQLERMRQDLDAMGYADTPIWITEIAIHVGYEAWRWVDFPNQLKGVGDYRWDFMSDYLNRMLDWLHENAEEKKIERWFFFTTWQDIVNVAADGYMGIIFFDGPEQGAPLTCLGEVYRARSLGSQRKACNRDGESIAAGIP